MTEPMDVPAICPTHHEDDTPATADEFGVHDRIARTIAQVVEQTAGGKTIGLSGTWGAGKSTVVRLLQQIYADRRDTRLIWTFDAWAHEGDPLRRTFLESLIAALAEKDWLVAKDWNDTLGFLSKRRKVTERHSAPRLTTMGVLVAVSVLLVPLGTALFSNQIRSGIVFGWDLSPDWLAVAGLLLAIGPLLALVTWSLAVVLRRNPARKWQDELMNAVTVFVQRTDTDSYTETLDSGDPTSLEFEAVFRGIMAAALGHHPERRLVLVVDNLDRVGPPQALAIWSTLQTFLQRRGSGGWIDQLWCLLPFDADAIRRLWQKESAAASPVAESFLDKTFQLRFEVPLPRLANWKDYLVAALGRALPEHRTTDEFFRIYRLYSVRRSATWVAPTPRQLKLFVNQIGSLHRQWQHEVPLEDLAYYVLLQNEGVPIVSMLLDGSLPAAAESGLVSDRVRSSLAALVYGSPVEQSHELLLRQPILDALEAGDSKRLEELAAVSDKFWLVLELALEQGGAEWPTAEGGLLLHAAAALDGAALAHLESPWRLQTLFRRLSAAVRATQVWTPMDARAIDGAIVMARRDPAVARIVYEGFTVVRFPQPETITSSQAHDFAEDYVRLAAALGFPRPSARLDTAGPESYIDLAMALAETDPNGDTWTHFGTRDMSAIEKTLLARQVVPGWGNAVRVAVTAGWTHWPDLIERARKALTDDEGYSPAQQLELLGALHALADVAEHKDATTLLDDLTGAVAFAVDPHAPADRALTLALGAVGTVENGKVATFADADTVGAWLYTLIARHKTLLGVTQPRRQLDPSAELARQALDDAVQRVTPELRQALATATLRFGDARRLFKAAHGGFRKTFQDRVVAIQVLEALADLGAPPRVLPPSLVVDEWDASFPSWSRYEFARAMRSRRPEIVAVLLHATPDSKLASAYAGALDAATSGDEPLVAFCASYLPTVPAAGWHDSLHGGEMGLPRLHAALAKRGTTVTLAPPVQDVVREFVITPPENMWIDPVTAAATLGTFGPGDREPVVDRVVAAFAALFDAHHALPVTARASVSQARMLATFAGDALLDPARMRALPRLLPAVATYAIGSVSDTWLPTLAAHVRADPALLQNLREDEQAALRDAARNQRDLQGLAEGTRAALAALSELLTTPTARSDIQGT